MDRAKAYAASLLDEIEKADAILVGGASGMSAAAGFRHYYERDDMFGELFGDFEEKYGYHSSFDGAYYPYPKSEQRWAYFARFCNAIFDAYTGEPYRDIAKLLEGKSFHVLTTNQDGQFDRVFPEGKISAIQGDWRYFQCSRGCHDKLYPAEKAYRELAEATNADLEIPSSLIPCCPECGSEMEPWVRSPMFLQGERYESEYAKVRKFIDEHKDERLLFLELGVGRMTPMFIQEPFWNLTYNLPNSRYATVNPKDAVVPTEIAERSLAVKDDIAAVFHEAAKIKEAGNLETLLAASADERKTEHAAVEDETDPCERAAMAIEDADAVVVSASNGLDIACGYNIFAPDERFREVFGGMAERYGFSSALEGAHSDFPNEAATWAFWSRFISAYAVDCGPLPLMKGLHETLGGKPHFVITCNANDHFQLAGFERDRVFETEGNVAYLQCERGCTDEVFPAAPYVHTIMEVGDGRPTEETVTDELIPRCPKCGEPMRPNVMGPGFAPSRETKAAATGFQEFVAAMHGRRLVVLELGIGSRNQAIKAPLMELVRSEENATYVTLNREQDLFVPDVIANKSIALPGDIDDTLPRLLALLGFDEAA